MSEIKKTFPIKGMHCASCVRVTERALKKTPGVTEAVVNLATQKATVTYNADLCSPKEMADSIAKTGYTLELEEKSETGREIEKKKELSSLKIKVAFSLISGGLILWGSFPGLINTSPSILQNFYIQLLLAFPIQFWAGFEFYRATVPALKNRTANMDTLVALSTGVAYLLFSHALRHISAATGVTLALAEPVTAFVLAVLVVGERPGWLAAGGGLLVLAGLMLVVFAELRSTQGR